MEYCVKSNLLSCVMLNSSMWVLLLILMGFQLMHRLFSISANLDRGTDNPEISFIS